MSKAKRRQPVNPTDELRQKFEQFASAHNKQHNADNLLDLLEQNAKRIIGNNPNDEADNAARAVLAYVGQARAGDMAAAIQAERHNWRAEWHEKGTTEALVVAAERVVRWRGVVIDCGNSAQHRAILNAIGEVDEVDIYHVIRAAGIKPSLSIEDKIKALREAMNKLSKRVPGYSFGVKAKRKVVTVNKI